MSNKSRGTALEHQVRDDLVERGWLVVRPGASLGPADLVALRAGWDPLLVQVKIGGYMLPAERRELCEAAERSGAVPLLADRQRRPEDRRRTWIRYRRLEAGEVAEPWDDGELREAA